MIFTHKLNRNHHAVTLGEFYKGDQVTELLFVGEKSKIRINGVEFFILTEYLTPIVGVVA